MHSTLFGIVILIGLTIYFVNPTNAAKKTQVTGTTDVEDFFVGPNWSDMFDWKLLKAFKSQKNRNVIVSPISLKIVLALLYGGSASPTKEQLQRVLNFHEDPAVTDQQYNTIVKSLQEKHENFTLNLGTRIFMKLKPFQKFQSGAKANYDADIDLINFDNAELASQHINKWAEQITEGRIRNLVHADDLHNLVMVVANALYFKGTWLKQFPRSLSHRGQFYISSNNTIHVDYMAISDYFYYADSKELQARVVRVPYQGDHYAMYFMLPHYKTGLGSLLDNLNPDILRSVLNLTDLIYVDMIIPKFKFDFQSKMDDILSDLGLDSMFNSAASFPGIVRGEPVKLVVSSIIQKAGIEVNEEGTTAFAATDVQVVNKFGDVQGVFNATHPFLFFIEDRKTGTILFSGKIENPIQSDPLPLESVNDRGPAAAGHGGHFSNPLNVPSSGNSLGQNSVPSSSEAIDYYPSPNNPNPVGLNRPRPSYQQTTPSYEQQPQNDKFHPFDNELLMKLDRSNENVFISPASIKATLAMILEGAKGESARQIAKQLNVRNLAASRQVIKDFIYGLKHGGSTTLEAGHGIFVSDQLEDDRTFNDYKKVIKDNYAAHVERIDFSKKAEASRNINAWVSKITHDLITEVLTPENFNQNSGLVLASALYFKGDWKYEFNPTLTQQRCFETSDKRCTKVRMMQITETFNYDLNTDLDAHVVELPYNDDAYSMLLIVPRTKGSSNIAAVLSRTNLKNILKTMDSSEVILHLPKFQIDYSTDLRAALDSMGIKDIFSRNANLTGISTSQQLIVDALMHRSRIDVGEKGTIAASVTTASVVPLIGNSSPVVIADHPFAFLIYNKEKKLVIFEGVVNQPTEAYSSDRFGNVLPIGANVDHEQPISTGQQQPFNPGRQQPISTGQQPISFGQQQPVSTGQQPISYGQQQPISTGRQQSINTGYQQPNSADQHQPIRQPQEQKVAQQYSTVSTGSGRTTPTLITPGVRYVDPQQLRASNPLHTQSQDNRGQAQDNLYEHDPFY